MSKADEKAILRLMQSKLSAFIGTNFVPHDALDDTKYIDYFDSVTVPGWPFIIKYEAQSDATGIAYHKDGTDVSFLILLSDPDDFDGGGTEFEALRRAGPLKLRQGEALIFNVQLVHRALPITRGERFVLSGFTQFVPELLKMKRTILTTWGTHI